MTPSDMNRFAYSVNDVSHLLGLGRTTIYKMIGEGHLNPIKIGSRTLIPATDIAALLPPKAA